MNTENTAAVAETPAAAPATTPETALVEKVKRPIVPAFEGQTEVRIPAFTKWVAAKGYTMAQISGKKGSPEYRLRQQLNAEYGRAKAEFASAGHNALNAQVLAGNLHFVRGTKKANGGVTVSYDPPAKTSAINKAKAEIAKLSADERAMLLKALTESK